jgi:4'-phosphopantetheinyl transferase
MCAVPLSPWQTPTYPFPLADTTVHLWRFPLSSATSLPELLSLDEQERAERLLLPHKTTAFRTARTRLRQILARYLNCTPQQVQLTITNQGKPFLADMPPQPLFFNLAHSGDWGLCAVSRVGDLGVDLEAIDVRLDYEPIARRFFSINEYRALQSIAPLRRRRQFYRLWTRKEAWLKGKGGGFSEPNLGLDALHIGSTGATAGGWWVKSLPVTQGYIGALAVAGSVAKVECCDWCD